MELKFYKCNICGKIIIMLNEVSTPTICCGEMMSPIVPGTTDAAVEKHVPVISKNGNLVEVTVGEVEHPMTGEHYIQWIVLQTKNGIQRKNLSPTDKPSAAFALLDNDEVIAAYAYCNLHGLWKSN
ncbi:MAG: desulfoferrodoxin [Treponema sp.]|nr:desulfoferrodoxin [Treponema sp.]